MNNMTRARLLVGVELLLADPEALENDALEGDLYILRDKLGRHRTTAGDTVKPASGPQSAP